MQKFIDFVYFTVQAGNGGRGAISFERAPFKPKGKPNGGDGGRGGNVILKVDPNLSELSHLINISIIKAENGRPGGANNKKGKDGNDTIIFVPPGSIVKDSDNNILKELLSPGEEFIVAYGGKGGHGNAFFKSPTNRSPHFAQPGEKGERKEISIELKLLADIGLVGPPNAGKSTLLKNLTDANPKIADYPFTTISPNLGIFYDEDNNHFSIADIPGLIEKASEGKGLGIQFLKHIERTKIICYVLDVSDKNFIRQYDMLLTEIKKYNPAILNKKSIIAGNKIDLLSEKELEKIKKLKFEFPFILVSALKNINLTELKKLFIENLKSAP